MGKGQAYPEWLTREAAAGQAGLSVGSSTWPNALSRLRGLGVVRVDRDRVRLADELFGG